MAAHKLNGHGQCSSGAGQRGGFGKFGGAPVRGRGAEGHLCLNNVKATRYTLPTSGR